MHAAIDKDRYFRQNVIGISGVEFLWGLGLPLVVESTFLQLFLKSMGASSFVIGLIPFFFFIGILDRFSGLQADAYRVVFLSAALLATVVLLCILKTDFSVNSTKDKISG